MTRKTKVDMFEELMCIPCTQKLRDKPCGTQMIAFLACAHFAPSKEPAVLLQHCGPERDAVLSCTKQQEATATATATAPS